MATQDTSNEDDKSEALDEEVETGADAQEDEASTDSKDTGTEETAEDDEEESDSDDDSETDDETDAEFTKRFTQFKGDTYEEYVPQLEKAYGEILGEMTRTRASQKETQKELDSLRAVVAENPELAKKLEESGNAPVDPALLKARQDMEEQMAKDYKEFTDAHPEIETDEQLAEEVLAYVQEFGAISRKNGKILSMKEALTKAWALAGRDDTSEQVAAKAKEIAAKPKVESAKKKVKKQEFTDAQLAVAQKWGANLDSLKTKSS